MNNGDRVRFYFNSRWNDGFYVGPFPPEPTCEVVVADKQYTYVVGKAVVMEWDGKIVKPLKELINTLIESGHKPDGDGFWRKREHLGFNPKMFACCGEQPDLNFAWEEEWLEVKKWIPGKDEPVMVRDAESCAWELRYSDGRLNEDGNLVCHNFGTKSLTSTGMTSWKMWREPTKEEIK